MSPARPKSKSQSLPPPPAAGGVKPAAKASRHRMSANRYARFLKYRQKSQPPRPERKPLLKEAAKAPGSPRLSPPPLRRAASRSPTPGRGVGFQEAAVVQEYDPGAPVSKAGSAAVAKALPRPPAPPPPSPPLRSLSEEASRGRHPLNANSAPGGKGGPKGKPGGRGTKRLTGRK